MGSTDSLHLIAELAVAVAGFASLVAVIGRRQGRDYPHWDAARLGSMLETSLLVIAFSLLPLLPFKAGLSAEFSWRISAGVFAVSGVALALHQGRRARKLPGYSFLRPWTILFGVLSGSAVLVLALGASGLLDVVEATYLWGLYAYLARSGLLFLRLVRSLLEHREP